MNYITGIQSDNIGLKKSSIYFAGKYLLKDASPCLVEEFSEADDESTAVIIAWAIYKIGDDDCVEKLNGLARNSTSEFVKSLCRSLCELKSYEKEVDH
jgi:hypothetical protein